MSEKNYKDGLTGIYNLEYLKDNFADIKSKNSELFLIAIDFCKLKYINDNFGHSAGDKSIITFARLAKIFFENDIVVRRSGDEFVVLTNSDIETINKKISKIRKAIDIASERRIIPIPFDFNCGIKKIEGDFVSELNKADITMYNAKKNNKRVEYYKQEFFQQHNDEKQYLKKIDDLINEDKLNIRKQEFFSISGEPQKFFEIYTRDEEGVTLFQRETREALRKNYKIKKIDLAAIEKIFFHRVPNYNKVLINVGSQTLMSLEFDFVKYIYDMSNLNNVNREEVVICVDLLDFEGESSSIVAKMKSLSKLGFKMAIQGLDFDRRLTLIPIVLNMDIDYVKIPIKMVIENQKEEKRKKLFLYMMSLLKDFNIQPIFVNIEKKEEFSLIANLGDHVLVRGYLFSEESDAIPTKKDQD